MASLYELTEDIVILQSMMEDEDVDEQALKDTLEGSEGAFDDKIESYCKVIKNLEADAEALKKESKRLSDKKKVIENNIARMKKAMMDALIVTGKREAGGLIKAKIQKNGGALPLIVDLEGADLPEEYRKVEYSADGAKIREALDNGEELAFARYGERGEHLGIS